MDYLDFELEISPGQGREYPVAVLRSPAGEARETMHFPFGELELENRLQAIQIALLRSGGRRRRVLSPEERAVQDFGQSLFNALLTGEVRNRYDVSQERAVQQGQGLRLKLRIRPPELAALPWEFLYDSRQAEYVCLSHDTPVVRYLELPRPPRPLTVTPPLHILGLIASPTDLEPLSVEREKQRVEEALKGLQAEGLVELTWLPGQTWRDLQRAMRRGCWHVFHFIGHGGFDRNADEGFIALANRQGETHRLMATQLARLLADHRALRLALLNACEGARGSQRDVFSSTASILVRRGVPAVLAMQYEITDRAAIEFACACYEALADGLPVDAAVTEARKAISLAVANTVEWGTPVLYMRAPDGVLFEIQERKEAAEPSTALVVEPEKDTQVDLVRLHRILSRRFDGEELRTLCFYLSVDYDSLRGEGKAAKARELIAHCQRYNHLSRLVSTGKELRPDIFWPKLTKAAEAPPKPLKSQRRKREMEQRRTRPALGSPSKSFEKRKEPTQLEIQPAEPKKIAHVDPTRLHQILTTSFDSEELRMLCSHLKINYDDLQGEDTTHKAKELVEYTVRQRSLSQLTTMGERMRPDIDWRDLSLEHKDEVVRLGRGTITQVSYAPDGRTLAVASSIGVWLYRLDQPDDGTLLPHTSWVWGVSWSSDGNLLAMGSKDGMVRVWNMPDRMLLLTPRPDIRTRWDRCLSLSPDSSKLAVSGLNGRPVSVLKVADGSVLCTFEGHTVCDLSWSPDGNLLASASHDKAVRVWNVVDEVSLFVLEGHTGLVTSVSWSPDGELLASGSYDNTVRVWRVADRTLLHTLEGHSNWVWSVSWSPKGDLLASGSRGGTVRVWDAVGGKELRALEGHTDEVISVSFSPAGDVLASGSHDGTVRMWNVADGKKVRVLKGYTRDITSVDWSPDGSQAVVSGRIVQVWNVSDRTLKHVLKEPTNWKKCASWSPDGRLIAVTANDRSVYVWNAVDGKLVHRLKGHRQDVASLSWSPDSRFLVSGDALGVVHVWNVADWLVVRTLEGHSKSITSTSWSADGRQLATGARDESVCVWNTTDGTLIQKLENHTRTEITSSINSLCWSPSGFLRALKVGYSSIVVWNVATGKVWRRLEGYETSSKCVGWSSNGTLLAGGVSNKNIRVWDLATTKVLCTLKGHTDIITSISWSPDDSRIITGSRDGTVRLWSVASGQ